MSLPNVAAIILYEIKSNIPSSLTKTNLLGISYHVRHLVTLICTRLRRVIITVYIISFTYI